MIDKPVTAVATEAIDSYGNATRNLIEACRAGNERMAGLLEQRWRQAIQQAGSELVVETVRSGAALQLAFHAWYSHSLTLAANSAEQGIDQLVRAAELGVGQAAAQAGAFEGSRAAVMFTPLSRAAEPAALFARAIAMHMEETSADLLSRLSGDGMADAIVELAPAQVPVAEAA